ncbi:MAG TPA: SCO family protein [Acidobacteriaceae bacterium]
MERLRERAVRAAVELTLGIALTVLAGGCKHSNSAVEKSAVAGDVAAQKYLKSFSIHGKIVSVDAKRGAVVLNHDAVPGFMDAMTMTYPLKDPTVASELHPGDVITATLLVRKVDDGYEDPKLDQIVVGAQAKPDYKPATEYHVPQAGDAVPDFRLVNENGQTVHLAQFKGKVVLLTFIYTRCPLEDYCPRMNKNFAAIDRQLKADPALYKATHLLSISFDPKFDTPVILKNYGMVYNGGSAKEFAHWEFAAAPEDQLGAMEQFFDLGVTPGESGSLNHSLSTAVIGKDGKVKAWYPTNEWTPAEVLDQIKSAAKV